MSRRTVSLAEFVLLLLALLAWAYTVRLSVASGTIYIRPDGSVDPPTAPITRVDNVVYNLTGDVFDLSIEVQRDNIVVDGGGHVLRGVGVASPDYQGVRLQDRSNVTIRGMEISGWGWGIGLDRSSRNAVCENNITGNRVYGVALFYGSSNNVVYNNNFVNDSTGLKIFVSSSNSVYGNNMTSNVGPPTGVGLSIEDSKDNTVVGNRFIGNWFGLTLYESTNNTFRNNVMADNVANLRVTGVRLSDFVNWFDSSNTVNGKPVYYLVNQRNKQVPVGAGYVAAVNSEGIAVKGQDLSNGSELMFANTTGSTVEAVDFTNNFVGVYLYSSSGNTFAHNNFVNNTVNVWSYDSSNTWDGGYPFGGNYWSYYTGFDLYSGMYQNVLGGDAIGDTPFDINADNQDRYPLMKPFRGTVRNLNSGKSYQTIRDAVNDASAEDAIFALSGTYNESIIIDRPVSLVGEDRETTIIDGRAELRVIWVHDTNAVMIKGFSIRNGSDSGVLLTNSNNCTVTEDKITKNGDGISLERSSHNTISSNLITANSFRGICFQNSSNDNNITANVITDSESGIELRSSNGTRVSSNELTYNQDGILLAQSSKTIIQYNEVTCLHDGVSLLDSSSGNDLFGNIIVSSGNCAISINRSSDNRIVGNTLSGNTFSFGIFESVNNAIYHNNIVDNQGIMLGNNCTNLWDNGYPSGGNYWSAYDGTDLYYGSSQNETGSDGVGDASYPLDYGNRDSYPLMYFYSSKPWDLTGPSTWIPDGKCDIRDIAAVALRFGAVVGDSKYDRRADAMGLVYMEPDLKVDIRDIAVIAKHFGETYS